MCMSKLSGKCKAVPFPEFRMEVDKKKLLLEFFPIIYWREEIEKLETEIKALQMTTPETYSVKIKKWALENCREQLKTAMENDAQNFKGRNRGEAIEASEMKAQQGDKGALLRLIRWNKEWLFKDWVRKRVLLAEALGDREFLGNISKAIKTIKKKSSQDQLIRFLRKLKVAGYNFDDKDKIEELRVFLYNYFNDLCSEDKKILKKDFIVDENDPIFLPLQSSENFNKLLKRNRIRGRKRFRKTMDTKK